MNQRVAIKPHKDPIGDAENLINHQYKLCMLNRQLHTLKELVEQLDMSVNKQNDDRHAFAAKPSSDRFEPNLTCMTCLCSPNDLFIDVHSVYEHVSDIFSKSFVDDCD